MLLEVLNTLAFAFVATETNFQPGKLREHGKIVGLVAAANVCLSKATADLLSRWSPESDLAAVQLKAHTFAHALLLEPLEWLGSMIGSAGALSALVMLLALAVLHVQRVERTAVCGILLGIGTFILLWTVGIDQHVHHHEPLKVLTLLVFFGAVCLADIRRKGHIDLSQFMSNALGAVLLVLPVCPCLSVLLSTGFLVIITVLENLRIDPHFLNPVIYYGTLYGPFMFVYYETKKHSLRQTILP